MYDIKRLEAAQQHQQHQQQQQEQQQQQQPEEQQHKEQAFGLSLNLSERLSGFSSSTTTVPPHQLTCSVITPPSPHCLPPLIGEPSHKGQQAVKPYQLRNPTEATHMTLLTLRRRRVFQRRACLLSILAAFVFGMALGVVLPMFGMPNNYFGDDSNAVDESLSPLPAASLQISVNLSQGDARTSYEQASPYSVAFIREAPADELSAEQVFRNVFHLEQDKRAPDSMLVKKLDTNDGSIKEFHVQRTANGRYRKGPERRLSRPTPRESNRAQPVESGEDDGIIKSDIYWGELVERALPKGFAPADQQSWQRYVAGEGQVMRLEPGCGRMQNRLVVFADGTRACARYRQNTDQIQGEIFSYYLGQLLNISNLAPTAATVIDTTTSSWATALGDITQAQWREQRPVVLTRWMPDLEPAGIPQPFQPLERHLNKYDVWNMTAKAVGAAAAAAGGGTTSTTGNGVGDKQQRGLLKRLEAASSQAYAHQSRMLESSSELSSSSLASTAVLQRLIELAQWSDLIVFDYLIANLDRVVNNLYNFQWNADIMAAPAHNLARQTDTQLLVFLDHESGLLHGYRLLKKYEAYHSLLLDNLCVFRQPTIAALQRLRAEGAGRRLRELFERTTTANVRDVLPSLPEKSIKILVERIDRVLGQVHKCREQLAAANDNKTR